LGITPEQDPRWSKKPNYGVLTRFDLELLHDNKALARRASGVLEKLKATGGDAIDYTPEQLKDLPDNLKARGFDLLLNMPDRVLKDPGPLRIAQQTLDWYASSKGGLLADFLGLNKTIPRIGSTPEQEKREIAEVRELAKRLELRLNIL
jgi:hypothetical protein